ncbi:6660_t:CDS:2 [Entrophospora sp. SA101]|nr:6660_t:CDS:2 [Entrophospora sp. SA101]
MNQPINCKSKLGFCSGSDLTLMTEFKYINVIYDDSSDDNLTLTPNSVPDDENNSFGNVAWPFPSTTTHLLQIVLMIIYSLQATIGNKIPFTIWEDPEESIVSYQQ